jgi:hypothetical protein
MNAASKQPKRVGVATPRKLAAYLPLRTVRVREAISVVQALSGTPGLASLTKMAALSAECLCLVTPLIPVPMRCAVQAGPLTHVQRSPRNSETASDIQTQWCLLAANSAVAAKLRQLAPALAAHLRTHGRDVQDIRIKIATHTSR